MQSQHNKTILHISFSTLPQQYGISKIDFDKYFDIQKIYRKIQKSRDRVVQDNTANSTF